MSLIPENNMERILNGEDVTPSCRAEYFVKQAIANAGSGGGDTYETVAEIAVGTMEYADGCYSNESSEFDVSEEIAAGETYYFNSTANPSTSIIPEENAVLFNCEMGEGGYPVPIIPNKAWFYVVFESDHKTIVGSYDNAIENNTVKILKKASGGETITVDDELSETSENPVQNKVVTAALGNISAPLVVTLRKNQGDTKYNPVGITNAEIIAAYESKRPVYVVIEGDDSMYVVLSASSTTDEIFASLIAPIPVLMVDKVGVLTYSSQGDWELNEGMFHYVPDYTIANAGQVLSVNAQGELEWVTPT